MLRSMFTAISSLNIHQAFMDVIADNLANANTTGYKASRVIFQDQFAQLVNAGAPPSNGTGGINPTQIGLGAQVGYISPIFTQGSLQATGRNLDLALQGDGFFIYSNENGIAYSRDGSIGVDANGYLVNSSNGMQIQGWQLQAGQTEVNNSGPIHSLQVPTDSTLARATSSITLTGNLDARPATSTVTATLSAYDSLGVIHPMTVTFTKGANNSWNWAVAGGGGTAANTGTVTFDSAGKYQGATGNPITLTTTNGSTASNPITIDFSQLNMLADDNAVAMAQQDGLAAGSLTDIYVGPKDGKIFLMYSNGLKQEIGQLATARFTNPTGLIRSGQNMFQLGLNSGDAQIGTADSGGRGMIVAGYREASNVDMAQEFTSMILAQRGFQASSRVVTASDEMLMELVNLKR